MYNITLSGKLMRFIGDEEDQYFLEETEVFFATREQALNTGLNIDIALSVNSKNEIYPGEGYYEPL